jgi:Spy/CpxP family protein refolding chaperone
MRRSIWAVALLTAGLVGGAAVTRAHAADEKAAADAPKAASSDKPAKKAKAVRLVKPWSGMTSLTDDQKTKIADLHKKSLAEKKEVEQREHDAIMALLDEKQKAEVATLTEKDTAAKKGAKSTDAEKDQPAGKAADKGTEKAG